VQHHGLGCKVQEQEKLDICSAEGQVRSLHIRETDEAIEAIRTLLARQSKED